MPTTTVKPKPTTTTTTTLGPCNLEYLLNGINSLQRQILQFKQEMEKWEKEYSDIQAEIFFWKPLYEMWYGPPVPTNQQLEETRQYYYGEILDSIIKIENLKATRSDPNAPSMENEIKAEENRLGNLQTKLNAGYANTPAAKELLNFHNNEEEYNRKKSKLYKDIEDTKAAKERFENYLSAANIRYQKCLKEKNIESKENNKTASAQEILQNYQDWYGTFVISEQNSQIYKTGFLA